MGIRVSLEHRTTYTFDRPVRIHPHVVRLRPAPHTRTSIEAYSMRVDPAAHWVNWQQDAFGNFLARLVFHEPARELSVVIGLVAEMDAINPFDFFVEEYAEHFPFRYPRELTADLEAYLRPVDEGEPGSGTGELVREWVRANPPRSQPRTIEFLIAINQALRRDVGYTIRLEPGVQTPDHTLRSALGSCRDSAWLLVSILREYGLAARFVSGYLIQLAQDTPSLDGPSGPPADFTDLHAWTEVYLPGAGWVGLDPTSGLFAGEGHIPLAATPHPVSSAPITGATDPVLATLEFSNTVRRVHEDPRVTLPYSDVQWNRIAATGAAVDLRARDAGIGLTVGGEPTFVSIDDQTGPEWTTDADGPHKRERAADLARRLRRIYAPTGLVQYRQGKWYPGEPLPRWDIALLWRADGKPLWHYPDLLIDPWLPAAPAPADPAPTGPGDVSPNGSAATPASGPARINGLPGGTDIAAMLRNGPVAEFGSAGQHLPSEHRVDPEGGDGPDGAGSPVAARPGSTNESERSAAPAAVGAALVADTSVVPPPPGAGTDLGRNSASAQEHSWRASESVAVGSGPGAEGAGIGTADSARSVLAHIADGLGLPESQVRAAYEDSLARMGAKARVPWGDPVSEIDDLVPERDSDRARAELLARLDESAGEPAAYVLPLHRRPDGGGWASADWRLRRGRIVLTEGDSPAGLRLPLGSISWEPPPETVENDPVAPPRARPLAGEPDAAVVPAYDAPITALVVEVRRGRMFVFLPPVTELDAYFDLVCRIEEAVATVGEPVVLEGYPPPVDARLHSLSITPDPGVIEVNVQPAETFAEQAELLDTLYEQARLARLGTEKFDVDGTHGGTGGGNHITLGGWTPARSPMLRRPDLLVSLLTYWQRHPALSYLFSGRFIGPTSQAPRVDEGRPESLYELEIAFAEIARLHPAGESDAGEQLSAPWVVDRALRHLLTDLTGNTHRAEFCIDKLYSPDSARGRLGLVELRGFEMPPHFRMAMVQSLLVRALVLRCWERPYTAPLLRHGVNLHGRYLLPHFLAADIAEVVADLRAHGIDFDMSWLDPFFEFRFPRIGTVVLGGMEVELRGAIEPWNTLGEQTTASGTARYVDSSVERLQVRVTGADRGRYLLTCNGFPVPLMPAGKEDTQVAGVRYRAWQPPNALHPSITVDAPLVFDVVDIEAGLSRGGCTYHVSHPGGMFYPGPPVNDLAAQSRRNRRFEPAGHTPGPVDIADLRARIAMQATDIGAPGILDLRRARTVWGLPGDR
ncbi:transglutaminase family protein [Nocardia sp. NPDC005978]|uniref:transglutaminase family protein n=1 Tax=Nocardia sp. NPDC005978 TaxID=3156725 RepID=UPI0033B9D896